MDPATEIKNALMILRRQRKLVPRMATQLFAAIERAQMDQLGTRLALGQIRKSLEEHSPTTCADNPCQACKAAAARVFAEASRALGLRA